MKRTLNLLVLVALLALAFGTQGVNSVQASKSAITIMAAPPAYYPSGPQTGVDESALTGWSVCYSSTYGSDYTDPANLLTTVLANCDGDYLLLAGGPAASTVFDVLAAAPRADVIVDTGTDTTTTHNANGSEWYYNDNWSWGFALGGDSVYKFSCDTNNVNPDLRLCWHTYNGSIDDGYRSGNTASFDSTYRRVIYEAFDAPATRLLGTTGSGGGTSTLVELDPTTGALISTIGPVGYSVNGLDYDPSSGTLYATTSVNDANFPSGLLTIDMTTGVGTPLVSLGNPEGCIPTNLRANAGGTLFAWSECEDDLIVINPATGDTFRVGESGLSTYAYGMSFDASNILYFVNGGGAIHTVNKYTGATTFITWTSLATHVHHGDFHPDTGRYWGIDTTGSGTKAIRVVNVGTGAVDATLSTVDNLHTLTFVPGNQPTVDVVEPILTVSNMTIPQNVPGGAVITTPPTATDETSPANPDVKCVPALDSVFPVGTTTVKCFTLDDQGNADFGNFDVTVTAAPGGNLLKKPDFATAAVFPYPWRAFGFRPPYTAALDCNYYNFGPCSVVFGPGNRAAFQQVNRTGVAGDMYSFGMYSASQNAPIGGDYRIELSFYNNLNKPMGKTSLYFNPLTHGFELLSGNAAPTGGYNKIVFRFVYNNSSGRAWFDDAFLYFLGGP